MIEDALVILSETDRLIDQLAFAQVCELGFAPDPDPFADAADPEEAAPAAVSKG